MVLLYLGSITSYCDTSTTFSHSKTRHDIIVRIAHEQHPVFAIEEGWMDTQEDYCHDAGLFPCCQPCSQTYANGRTSCQNLSSMAPPLSPSHHNAKSKTRTCWTVGPLGSGRHYPCDSSLLFISIRHTAHLSCQLLSP